MQLSSVVGPWLHMDFIDSSNIQVYIGCLAAAVDATGADGTATDAAEAVQEGASTSAEAVAQACWNSAASGLVIACNCSVAAVFVLSSLTLQSCAGALP